MSDEFLIIKGTLNCSRIDKKRLFKKEGKPGSYLKIVLIQKKDRDTYGRVQFMVKEDISKEERQAGVDGNFIGDAYISEAKPKSKPADPNNPPTARTKPKGPGGLPF